MLNGIVLVSTRESHTLNRSQPAPRRRDFDRFDAPYPPS